MRTTVAIDDDLLVSVKKLAAERGTSVSAVVVEALRRFVRRQEGGRGRARFVMPTFDGGGGTTDTSPLEFHAGSGDDTLKHVADAQHAAIAMEHACKWVARDPDFQRFVPHGLKLQMLRP